MKTVQDELAKITKELHEMNKNLKVLAEYCLASSTVHTFRQTKQENYISKEGE